MAKDNLVSATLTAADAQAVSDAIASIIAKLPFLIDLSPLEKRRLFKMGDGSRSFVEKALIAAQANPQVLPPAFDVAEYARDWALWGQLGPIATQLTQLGELVDDTLVALGADLMNAGLTAYGHLSHASVGGLEEIKADLGQRFARRGASGAGATASGGASTAS
jgi:hypothetical protein